MSSQVRQRRKASTESDKNIVKMLDTIELNTFNGGTPRARCYSSSGQEIIANARAKQLAKKVNKIEELLMDLSADLPTRHLDHFREFASNGGLVEGRFREEIWPILAEQMPAANHLGQGVEDRYSVSSRQQTNYLTTPSNGRLLSDSRTCSDSEVFDSARSSFGSDDFDEDEDQMQDAASSPTSVSLEELQMHAEWNQVELDVHRTLARFPPNTSDVERRQLQSDLIPMIVELLYGNPSFRYYQGFHDVCLTLMLALDVDRAKKVGRHLVERGAFRNYLLKSLEESALKELQLIYVILHKCDPLLEKRLRHAELSTLFALSWPITWFSHALHSFDQIALCFDLFLSSDPLMPIYVSAALVEHRRDEIFAVEPEMPVLHHLLNHIPTTIDIEAVLERARKLFAEYRPKMIQEKYLVDYEAMCRAENRQNAAPPPSGTLQRNAIQQRILFGGVAFAGLAAAYLWLSAYQHEFKML